MEISIGKHPAISINAEKKEHIQLNDLRLRLVLIPLFALSIPNLTGLIDNAHHSFVELLLHYGYFLLIAIFIYQGNRFFLFKLREHFDWFKNPVRKVMALLLAVTLYTLPLTVGMLVFWYRQVSNSEIDWKVIQNVSLMNVICVIFVVHLYETVFLIKETESEKLKAEKLERSKAQAELEALKNQIDPHFIFNSLNTLSHLIESHPAKAKLFNDHLADVYRYILQNKGHNLVLLREELVFLENYFSLLKIRFENALSLNIIMDSHRTDQLLIPPISLQLLLENAIKHNEFTVQEPLTITLIMQEDRIEMVNEVRPKNLRKPSSKIGLLNLKERYKLITGQEIDVVEGGQNFRVSLPLLNVIS